jgi:AbrB family looped-hinge helix DNA binding protein
MLGSTMTRKGQITIPKAIRNHLGVKAGENVFFLMRGKEVSLKVIKGTFLDLKGSVPPWAYPKDFDRIRHVVKRSVAKRVAGHG